MPSLLLVLLVEPDEGARVEREGGRGCKEGGPGENMPSLLLVLLAELDEGARWREGRGRQQLQQRRPGRGERRRFSSPCHHDEGHGGGCVQGSIRPTSSPSLPSYSHPHPPPTLTLPSHHHHHSPPPPPPFSRPPTGDAAPCPPSSSSFSRGCLRLCCGLCCARGVVCEGSL